MLFLMAVGLWILKPGEVFFFCAEVSRSITDQSIYNLVQDIFPFPLFHGVVKVVDHRHQLLMLLVNLYNLYAEAFIPLNQRHFNSPCRFVSRHRSRSQSPQGASRITQIWLFSVINTSSANAV